MTTDEKALRERLTREASMCPFPVGDILSALVDLVAKQDERIAELETKIATCGGTFGSVWSSVPYPETSE